MKTDEELIGDRCLTVGHSLTVNGKPVEMKMDVRPLFDELGAFRGASRVSDSFDKAFRDEIDKARMELKK